MNYRHMYEQFLKSDLLSYVYNAIMKWCTYTVHPTICHNLNHIASYIANYINNHFSAANLFLCKMNYRHLTNTTGTPLIILCPLDAVNTFAVIMEY